MTARRRRGGTPPSELNAAPKTNAAPSPPAGADGVLAAAAALVEPVGDLGAYFAAIEDAFGRRRGSALLLSPADWQVVQRWHQAGIPLTLVVTALDEVFARRRERGARGRINSLRYCANAVEAAWEERQELLATGLQADVEELRPEERLVGLAVALPASLPDRERWAGRLLALRGDAAAVEAELARLDRELLDSLAATLTAEDEAALDVEVERALTPVRARLGADELADARERLRRGALRRMRELPLLSLFTVSSSG